MSDHTIVIIRVVKIFLFSSSVYSCHLSSSASVRSIPFLSFIEPICAWNALYCSHWLLRKAFLSLLAILWNSAFISLYLSFSPLPLASLLFSDICKDFSTILPFCISFSWGWPWSLLLYNVTNLHPQFFRHSEEKGIPDHLTCFLRNLYATARTGLVTTDWFQIGKGIRQGCILSPYLFNLYAEYIMRNAGLDEAQAGIKVVGRNVNNLRYVDDTTLW